MKYSANNRTFKTVLKKQKGGSVIGKGGFGCVVSPYVPCNSRKTTEKKQKLVSKILFKEIPNDDV